MNPAAFVRARLHRRIFLWFGAAILLTGLIVGGGMAALGGSPWRLEQRRAETFLGDRYARVWDDPRAREDLTSDIERDLHVDVRVTDAEPPDVRRWGHWRFPVRRGPLTVGWVSISPLHDRGGGFHPALAFLVAGLVLWAASGAIARRLSRPFGELARVADEIGSGNLKSRVRLPRRRAHGEAAMLATSINTMADRIEKQFSDQRELLATVSHEIRTPLARVRLLVELARERGVEDGALSEIDREAIEMDTLVSDLLARSRLDFSALSATPLDAVEIAGRALERAGIGRDRLQASLSRPVEIVADPTLVARALANLVDNAQTHGKGLTRMRVKREADAVAFEVEDAGPGMEDRDAARLFEPFYRGAPGPAEKPSLGLGLSLVRRIAEAHGGRAYARPREGGGSLVGFTLAAHPKAEA